MECNDIQISFSNCSLADTELAQLINRLDQSKLSSWRQKFKKLNLFGNALTHIGVNEFLEEV